jgi:hypothetical protein
MPSLASHSSRLKGLVGFFVLAIALPGCTRQKTDKEAVDQWFKSNPEAKRFNIGRFAGTVTIDGLPPEKKSNSRLFILLNDPQHLEKLPTRYMEVAEDGRFSFMTYLAGDGVPVGKYVVEFAQLGLPRGGTLRRGGGVASVYRGPDGLKNLYNDPEKNKDIKDFVVDVTEPGRDDYQFNLSVAGKEPASPGKYSATIVVGQ